MDRPEASQLTRPVSTLREHLALIVRAAIDAADARVLVERALADADIVDSLQRAAAVHVIAVGKAAHPMFDALASTTSVAVASHVVAGPRDAGHPVPDYRSVNVAERARALAKRVTPGELLLVLLSGGASSIMAMPRAPLSLEAKQDASRTLLARGANITELNIVRKHLSAIKGGELAAACPGSVLTLAVSDVVGNDLTVIGSGPTVADPSTFDDALAVIDAHGGRRSYPGAVVSVLEHGAAGRAPETPKPGAPWFMRSAARVIGGAADALAGAQAAAASLGYHVQLIAQPVVGDARTVAPEHVKTVAQLAAGAPRPLCVLSAGETTVNVTGQGTGGRNQELALALASGLETLGANAVAASVGTDGVDGPTDAAGAVVDTTTLARARQRNLAPERYLADNDTYEFFRALEDLVLIGPTSTNVGDIQVVLID